MARVPGVLAADLSFLAPFAEASDRKLTKAQDPARGPLSLKGLFSACFGVSVDRSAFRHGLGVLGVWRVFWVSVFIFAAPGEVQGVPGKR